MWRDTLYVAFDILAPKSVTDKTPKVNKFEFSRTNSSV